jgi:hypothetical protein
LLELDFHQWGFEILNTSNKKTDKIMKQNQKWFATALAVASGLVIAGSAQAQYIETPLATFDNTFALSATYANWNDPGYLVFNGGSGYEPTLTYGASGFEVNALGYGSGAYNEPTAINASGAIGWQVTFTITAPTATQGSFWMNVGIDMSDGTHLVHLSDNAPGGGWYGYGSFTQGTYTLTGGFADAYGTAALDTSDITAFNLEFDPAAYDASQGGPGTPYDITYESLVLLTPVPEPTTLALLAIGAAGLLIARRRVS